VLPGAVLVLAGLVAVVRGRRRGAGGDPPGAGRPDLGQPA
jgi:hypothetical protein